MVSKRILWLGLLLMDELHRAVAPFLPASGGIHSGVNPPPGPSGEPSFFPFLKLRQTSTSLILVLQLQKDMVGLAEILFRN